jgi:5-methylcytosine-specific restriction endonuclease McrA
MVNYYANHEEKKQSLKRRYHSDLEKSRERNRASYEKHSSIRREYAKAYRQQNPEKSKAARSVGKHRRRSAEGGFTSKDILQMLESQSKQCVYCKIDISLSYHVDHKVPLSRGGTNHLYNIQLLCPKCNLSKHTCDHETFIKRIGMKYGSS